MIPESWQPIIDTVQIPHVDTDRDTEDVPALSGPESVVDSVEGLTDPIAAQLTSFELVDYFAGQGDLERALAIAGELPPHEITINKLLHSLPHTSEVYSFVSMLASTAEDPEYVGYLYMLIEAHRQHDDEPSDTSSF